MRFLHNQIENELRQKQKIIWTRIQSEKALKNPSRKKFSVVFIHHRTPPMQMIRSLLLMKTMIMMEMEMARWHFLDWIHFEKVSLVLHRQMNSKNHRSVLKEIDFSGREMEGLLDEEELSHPVRVFPHIHLRTDRFSVVVLFSAKENLRNHLEEMKNSIDLDLNDSLMVLWNSLPVLMLMLVQDRNDEIPEKKSMLKKFLVRLIEEISLVNLDQHWFLIISDVHWSCTPELDYEMLNESTSNQWKISKRFFRNRFVDQWEKVKFTLSYRLIFLVQIEAFLHGVFFGNVGIRFEQVEHYFVQQKIFLDDLLDYDSVVFPISVVLQYLSWFLIDSYSTIPWWRIKWNSILARIYSMNWSVPFSVWLFRDIHLRVVILDVGFSWSKVDREKKDFRDGRRRRLICYKSISIILNSW